MNRCRLPWERGGAILRDLLLPVLSVRFSFQNEHSQDSVQTGSDTCPVLPRDTSDAEKNWSCCTSHLWEEEETCWQQEALLGVLPVPAHPALVTHCWGDGTDWLPRTHSARDTGASNTGAEPGLPHGFAQDPSRNPHCPRPRDRTELRAAFL